MAQESYADFSIIQKYLDQKKQHDEAVKRYQGRIAELETTIRALKNETDAKDQAIGQLKSQLEEKKVQIEEKEKRLQELGIQLHRLNKQLTNGQPEERPQGLGENAAHKTKFGFLKK